MLRTTLVAALVLSLASGVWAADNAKKVTKDLSSGNPTQLVDVIIHFQTKITPGLLNRMGLKGALVKQSLDSINSVVFTIPLALANQLAADEDVQFITRDRAVTSTDTTTPDYGWVTALGLNSSSESIAYDGSGIGVAIIDSGVDDDDDLKDAGKNRIVYKQSFVPGDASTSDAYGHGNHVAGILGGNGKRSSGGDFLYKVRGIAPNVKIVSLRALDASGHGADSAVIAAIQRAVELKSTYNIRVLNLSLGRGVFDSAANDPLCKAVQSAWQAGIVVVVAAGNNGRDNSNNNQGYGTISSPGNSPYVITVGAMNTLGTPSRTDDKIASYSSKGPTQIDHFVKPDLVAPGNRIFSLRDVDSYLDKNYPDNRIPKYAITKSTKSDISPDYYQLSGSSMATPMVSGAAALMLQKDPSLTPDDVKARLMKTASKLPPMSVINIDPVTNVVYTSQNDVFTVGAGYLDVQAALANTDRTGGLAALSTVAKNDATTGNVYMVNPDLAIWGTLAVWGTNGVWSNLAIWGTGSVWSTTSVNGNLAIWGTGAVWGTNTSNAYLAIWGSLAVWGTNTNTVDSLHATLQGDK